MLERLRTAVEASPDDVTLRLDLARLLLDVERPTDALEHCTAVLRLSPGNGEALDALSAATAMLLAPRQDAGTAAGRPRRPTTAGPPALASYDWSAAEAELSGLVPVAVSASGCAEQRGFGGPPRSPHITLSDVAGMTAEKQRLAEALLTPQDDRTIWRRPALRPAGRLLLYGPPGCGKTFLARAAAGEVGASFHLVNLAEVPAADDPSAELRAAFATARRDAPSVLLLDEVDALAQWRGRARSEPGRRPLMHRLLAELDATAPADGVRVLAASDYPWDVDPSLKRPGRFDASLLIGPPDLAAREAILRELLQDRPLDGIEARSLAARSEGWSAADLAAACDRAGQRAQADSARTGVWRPIDRRDLGAVMAVMASSMAPWYDLARNVARSGAMDAEYPELIVHLKARHLL